MATVQSKSKDEKVECFYDSNFDKETFMLFLPQGSNIAAVKINKYDLENTIQTLKDFDQKMRTAGAIRRLE